MKNEELLLGKTIDRLEHNTDGDEEGIIFFFTDGTTATITSNASKFMYYLLIQ